MEAVKLAPFLVIRESDPVKFLRSEDYNPWQAAKKLVLHWEYRKWIFRDRWLLPLDDESGNGAMNPNDIDLLRHGWSVFVPTNDPRLGNFFWVDHGKYHGHSFDSYLRVAFYLGTLAQDVVSQTNGATAIRLISSKDEGVEPPFTVELFKCANACWKMLKEALPLRLKRVLFLKETATDKGNMVHLFLSRVSSSVMQLLGNNAPIMVPVKSAKMAAEVLVDLGIPRDKIPVSHGGSWTYDRKFEWRQLITNEKDSAKMVNIPWLADSTGLDEERNKAVAALDARRAYQRRRLQQSKIQEEAQRTTQTRECFARITFETSTLYYSSTCVFRNA